MWLPGLSCFNPEPKSAMHKLHFLSPFFMRLPTPALFLLLTSWGLPLSRGALLSSEETSGYALVEMDVQRRATE